jgi:hypothetical protein
MDPFTLLCVWLSGCAAGFIAGFIVRFERDDIHGSSLDDSNVKIHPMPRIKKKDRLMAS